jgi:hypothetical protein
LFVFVFSWQALEDLHQGILYSLRSSDTVPICLFVLFYFFASSRKFQQGIFYSLGTSDTVPISLGWFGLVCVSVCLRVFFSCFLGFVFASSRKFASRYFLLSQRHASLP